jgi:hypothetical protein
MQCIFPKATRQANENSIRNLKQDQNRIESSAMDSLDNESHQVGAQKRRGGFDLIRAANRILDWLLGIAPDEVLNPKANVPPSSDPAIALRRRANAMRANAMDPNTGEIDYDALAGSQAYAEFRNLTRTLGRYTLQDMGDRQSQKAFWINLYNALILDAVISYGLRGSLQTQLGIFRRAAYTVGGLRFSADDIEHGILRGNRRNPMLPFPPFGRGDPRLEFSMTSPDPRVHFALVCGARSCPPIAFYDKSRLDEQLESACINFINAGGAEFDAESRVLRLSKILQWYQGDFGGRRGVIECVVRCTRDFELQTALESERVRLRYMRYDWSLNTM